ncbi:TonB-dependent receptor [Thalassotalea litorea]|uniref:TonB-dependent receptor n=1 Tax=Thalassotalea litorea TaxID=2020715 RepID=A0A5R9IW73_9GAMM|nr:TonB-dependent receptor [Thalassotalea litorea]TLU67631.1 TonB-dependent receptor [Thalassotalea litorea]
MIIKKSAYGVMVCAVLTALPSMSHAQAQAPKATQSKAVQTDKSDASASLVSGSLSDSSLLENTLLDTIVVTPSRQSTKMRDSQVTVARLDQDAIARENISHIQQVLNGVSGVNLHRGSGQEYLSAIRSPVLTGSGACGAILLLENNIPLRPASFCNVNGLIESHHEQAELIEVQKGPGNGFYGSNAVHGAINVINPSSINQDQSLSLQLGEYGHGRVGLKTAGDKFSTTTTLFHEDGYRHDARVDWQKFSLSYEGDRQHTLQNSLLTIVNLNQNTAGYITGKDSYQDKQKARSNPNPEAYRDIFAARVSQRYQFEQFGQFTPYARVSKMEFLMHFLPGKPLETNEHISLGGMWQNQWQSDALGTINYGFDIDIADIELVQEQFSPTQGSAFLMATIPSGKQYDFNVRTINSGAFVQLQKKLTPKLQLNTGLRAEYSRYDYDNQMNSGRVDELGDACSFGGCRYTRPDDSIDSFTDVSVNIGMIYQLTEQQQWLVTANQGFRPPQVTELYRLQGEQFVTELDSEKIQGLELTWRGDWHQQQFNLSAYYYQKQDVIFRDSEQYTRNGGETEHQGIEVSWSYQISDSLQSQLEYTFAKHSYANTPAGLDTDISGNDMDTAPTGFGRWRLLYQANDQHNITLSIGHMGEYYTDIDNLHRYSGHVLVDAYYNWKISDKWQLGVKGLNLMDRAYAERADYTVFTQDRYFPGLDRRFFIHLNYAI